MRDASLKKPEFPGGMQHWGKGLNFVREDLFLLRHGAELLFNHLGSPLIGRVEHKNKDIWNHQQLMTSISGDAPMISHGYYVFAVYLMKYPYYCWWNPMKSGLIPLKNKYFCWLNHQPIKTYWPYSFCHHLTYPWHQLGTTDGQKHDIPYILPYISILVWRYDIS